MHASKLKGYDSPGVPGTPLPKNEGEAVDAEECKSITGKAMYRVTKIWASGANTTSFAADRSQLKQVTLCNIEITGDLEDMCRLFFAGNLETFGS